MGNYILAENKYILDSYYQMIGNCISLTNIPIGTWKFENTSQCIVQLPLNVNKFIDSRCRTTIGIMYNLCHGRRPIVQGVVMNPVDHLHGVGEGHTKGSKLSISP
ncbi:hypothetical protein CY35_14G087000 [Sphagnum magellanicum]|nr:hypothetical protein CY35_14G087000 [Sphagnum magellanicum]